MSNATDSATHQPTDMWGARAGAAADGGSAAADAGAPPEDDQWEALEEKLQKAKLKYQSSYPEEERQFLGWPLD